MDKGWKHGKSHMEWISASEREAGRSASSSNEFKNIWRLTPLLPYIFMAWCLIKQIKHFACVQWLPFLRTVAHLLVFLTVWLNASVRKNSVIHRVGTDRCATLHARKWSL
jgi:hypothetical protein